jgi:hypothetical protein
MLDGLLDCWIDGWIDLIDGMLNNGVKLLLT